MFMFLSPYNVHELLLVYQNIYTLCFYIKFDWMYPNSTVNLGKGVHLIFSGVYKRYPFQ